MSARDIDARPVTLVDIPLVMRLTDDSVILDSALGYTRDVHGPNGALLSSILLPQRGLITLLARSDKQQVIGQFRLKPDDPNAHIVYVAPGIHAEQEDTAWLNVFDAMAREAGKHQAHTLIAEVNESSLLFETMRQCGFAVYARQQIWRLDANSFNHHPVQNIVLREQTDADVPGILSLFSAVVPGMLQQVTTPAIDERGLVLKMNDHIEVFVAVVEGKNGIFVTPYLHPDLQVDTPSVFAAIVKALPRLDKLPLYVCVRRHQDWFTMSLHALGFKPGPLQAVMVRHITAGVRQARFESIPKGLRATPVKPPTRPLHEISLQSEM